ncbi:enoyl-CoA hydratase [Tepidamorphus gemmatus]|uniref:Enoyl-CoA hydratase n=1 Tax=Tepidamorphus gemmatus TaxID=747076 RepID=A0A4R3M4W9_9HYPH|nr:crotonase/enoyl-CoA hydratase family protein [Tepidamorphus gemmatus]TCT06457.1 enoyl-CoA hydratase [Tepidamorphus gemmatus]
MTEQIVRSCDDGVMVLRLNRPDKRNAMTGAMYQALADALTDAEADLGIRAIVLLGTPGTFCAGNDINDFLSRSPDTPSQPVQAFLYALARSSVPMVAGVDGDAVGIGTTMLLHCDMVLATPRARLRLPFVNLGIVPEAGSTLLLPRIMGHARAAELVMLGEPVGASRAVELGLVNRLVEPDALEAETLAVASRLAAQPPGALRDTKRLLKGDRGALEATIAEEIRIVAKRLGSAEAREAFTAFLEKRPPDFSKLR